MADPTKTFMLLSELENIDVHEDRILDELLRRGAALEESERRSRMVTVAELRALRSGLQSLETAIDALQTGVARAEQAAEQGVTPKNGNGAPPPAVTTGAPPAAVTTAAAAPDPAAAQPPAPPPSFEELAARIREHDATGDQLRTILRERFAALDAQAGDAVAAGPDAGPGGGGG
ncbi:MAG: hypothetical protein QOE31_2243, partial [Solirubrobacteraceae bacterium]|nr:hypothetical protein [Solirubrobacteraceae bacterium]